MKRKTVLKLIKKSKENKEKTNKQLIGEPIKALLVSMLRKEN